MNIFENFSDYISLNDFYKKALRNLCGPRIIDLLLHFPYDVQIRTCDYEKIKHNKSERPMMFNDVVDIVGHDFGMQKSSPFKAICKGKYGDVEIIHFNGSKGYLKTKYPIGSTLFVSGKCQLRSNGGMSIIHPDVVSKSLFLYKDSIDPIYQLSGSLTNNVVMSAIRQVLKIVSDIDEWLPPYVLQQYNWMSFKDSIYNIHNPKSVEDIRSESPFIKRIAFDEMLANKMCMLSVKKRLDAMECVPFKRDLELINSVKLPFVLTDEQKNVLNEILADLESTNPMNRLVQGDVGSGKTIVAFLACLSVISAGYQVAFIAPTEALASQHFSTFMKYAHDLGINVDLVIAKNRKYRREQQDGLYNGKTQLVVGTHALLEDNIQFNKLGLVIIDEQQRFGVMQRMKLIEKGNVMNALYLSATPIPRTMMMSIYGDLDVSIISKRPEMMLPVETVVVNKKKLDDVVNRIKSYDSQVYWVCPYIEESESRNVIDINTRYQYLLDSIGSVGILHGKLKPAEKDQVLEDFRENKFKVLVATTVIEVGIDIPNANIIVIENAEMFGLSQLHQLRGRVGRGGDKSFCILIHGYNMTQQAVERLQMMKKSNDGFELSEADLKLRGYGDLFGTAQSGFRSFKIFNFSLHTDMLEAAHRLALHLPKNDMLLEIFSRLDSVKLM